MRRLVLDTSVLVEYIVLRSVYRPKVDEIFNRSTAGEVELLITPLTLSETLYIASKIYEAAGIHDPNDEALNYVEWVKAKAKVIDMEDEIIVRAGELKKLLHIALSDCYVIAAAERLKATPVFRSVEKEMEPVLDELRRLGVRFLKEIEI